jgi:hypothetical protein
MGTRLESATPPVKVAFQTFAEELANRGSNDENIGVASLVIRDA